MTATVFITNITYSKQNLPIFLLFHFFPFFFHYFLLFPAFNVLLISISTRKTQNQRSIVTIGFFRSTLVSWKRKKKAVCIILKNKPRHARPCTSAFYHCCFFLFWNEIWLLTCPRIDTRKLIGQNLNSLLQLAKYSSLYGERSDEYNSFQKFFFLNSFAILVAKINYVFYKNYDCFSIFL